MSADEEKEVMVWLAVISRGTDLENATYGEMADEMIIELRDRGAIFIINHSGGKDSQCMFLTMKELIPSNQLIFNSLIIRI